MVSSMNNIKKLFGGEIEIIAAGSETEGRFDLLKSTFSPNTEVPLHVHSRYSETIYLKSGKLPILLKNKMARLKPVDHFVIPAGTPHVVINADQTSVATVVCAPGGFARLVQTAGVDPDSNEKVDMELFKKIGD